MLYRGFQNPNTQTDENLSTFQTFLNTFFWSGWITRVILLSYLSFPKNLINIQMLVTNLILQLLLLLLLYLIAYFVEGDKKKISFCESLRQ